MANFVNKSGYLTQSEIDKNAKVVWAYMLSKGWTKQAIAALLGNMQAESHINPLLTEVGGGTTAAGAGYGLVQWTPKSNLTDITSKKGWNYKDGFRQLDVIHYEMQTGKQWIDVGFGMSFRQFSVSKRSPTYLANVFIKCYERPRDSTQPIRGTHAERFYRLFKNVGADGSGGGSSDQYKTFKEDLIKKNSATRPGTKMKKPVGIIIHSMPAGRGASSYKNTLASKNGGVKFGCHILVDSTDTINIVPLEEQVYHAERGENKSSIAKPNSCTISIGVETNSTGAISDKAMSKLIAVTAELANEFSIKSDNIMHAYLVDGVKEPLSWVKNQFLYSTFLGLVEKTKQDGKDIILNPDYEEDFGEGGSPSANVVGKSHIAKLIKEAATYEGRGSNGIAYRMGGNNIQHGGTGDCSSFTQALLMRHGVANPGRNTVMQEASKVGKTLPLSQARAGDTIVMTAHGSDGGGPGGHTGIVYKKGHMIDLHGPDPGGFVSKTNYGAPGYLNGYSAVVKRWYSDAVYREYIDDQNGGGNKEKPEKPTSKSTKTYTLRVKSPINAMSGDTSGQAVKRMSRDEIFRTQDITPTSYKIGPDMFVRRGEKGVFLSELEADFSAIGSVETVNRCAVYSDKSLSAETVVENGSDKVVKKGEVLDVYEKHNGLFRVGSYDNDEWISASSGYTEFSSYITGEFEASGDFLSGQKVSVEVGSEVSNRELAAEDSGIKPMAKYTLAAREAIFPIGSVVEYEIPTKPELNGTGVVITNNVNSENISVYVEDEVDKINFGTRNGIVRYVDFVEVKDIPQYIQRELVKEEEIEDEEFS